jgi:putative transcriptional regulator
MKRQRIRCLLLKIENDLCWKTHQLLSSKQKVLKAFGKHLRALREKKGLTQAELSNAINKDRQSLQRVEAGNISPSLFYLYELSEGLEVKLSELMSFKID